MTGFSGDIIDLETFAFQTKGRYLCLEPGRLANGSAAQEVGKHDENHRLESTRAVDVSAACSELQGMDVCMSAIWPIFLRSAVGSNWPAQQQVQYN